MKNILINATVPAVENLYLKRDWQAIIKKRKGVRIPTDCPLDLDNFVHDQPNSVWEVMARDQVKIFENSTFLKDIHDCPESVYNTPSDLFLLDKETKSLLKKRSIGALVFLEKSASAIPIKAHWDYPVRKNEAFNWKQFFRDDVMNTKLTTNSLIIFDKFLFANFEDGLNSFYDILDAIMPKHFGGCYHVLLVTDDEKTMEMRREESLEETIKLIQCYLPSLGRNYDTLLEILLVHPLGESARGRKWSREEQSLHSFYNDIHDRLIISNSFCASVGHALDSVRETNEGEQVSSMKQKPSFNAIYSGIDNRYQDLDHLPYKECEDSVISLRKFINSPNPMCRFFSNGEEQEDVKTLQNRLLKTGVELK